MALVAPNVCRYTVVGTLAGQDCMNIFDVAIDPDALTNRSEAISIVGGDLLNQWDDHILPRLVNDYTATEVRWVDLDAPDGETGSVSSTSGNTWPASGASTETPLPNHTYAKLVKTLEGKTRTQRNGALRLGGLPESYTDAAAPNTITTVARTALNTAFENLKDGINGLTDVGTANLVVVHTVNDVFTDYSEIANYTCAPVVGTIRRRMPGYGT